MHKQSVCRVPVEFFIGPRLLSGYVSLARGRRLLDLLNRSGSLARDIQSDYVEFIPDGDSDVGEAEEIQPRYVRKAAIHIAALSNPGVARGRRSAMLGIRTVVNKTAARVSLELKGYLLEGNVHCAGGQTVRDVLDENAFFLPLTDVAIIRDGHFHATRPFVAVRKDRIVSLTLASPVLAGLSGSGPSELAGGRA